MCHRPCARWNASILPDGPGAFGSVGPALYIDCWPCWSSFMFGPNRYCGVFVTFKDGALGWVPGSAGTGVWLNKRSKPEGEGVDCPQTAPMVPSAVGGGPGSGGGAGAAGSPGAAGGGSAAAVAAEATAAP